MQLDITTQKISAIQDYREWVEVTFGFRTSLKQAKDAVERLAAEKAEQERKHRVDVAERVYWLLNDEGLVGQFPTKESVFARLFPSG